MANKAAAQISAIAATNALAPAVSLPFSRSSGFLAYSRRVTANTAARPSLAAIRLAGNAPQWWRFSCFLPTNAATILQKLLIFFLEQKRRHNRPTACCHIE
jgi:hypothetical protein